MTTAAEYKAARLQETKDVKAAVIAAGYSDVSVSHGRGSAYGWLQVDATFTAGEWRDHYNAVLQIAKTASKRSAYGCENITINVSKKKDFVLNVETVKKCRCSNILMGSEQRGTRCNDCLDKGVAEFSHVPEDGFRKPKTISDLTMIAARVADLLAAVAKHIDPKHPMLISRDEAVRLVTDKYFDVCGVLTFEIATSKL